MTVGSARPHVVLKLKQKFSTVRQINRQNLNAVTPTVRTGTFVNPHMSLPRSATPLRVLRKHASRRRLLLRMECCSRRSVRFHVAAGAVLVDAGLYERVQVTRLASRATPSRKVCGEQLERFVKRLDSRHYTGHPASTQLIRTIN